MRVAIIYQSMKPGNNPRRKKQEKHFEVPFEGTHEMQYKILIKDSNFEKWNQIKRRYISFNIYYTFMAIIIMEQCSHYKVYQVSHILILKK